MPSSQTAGEIPATEARGCGSGGSTEHTGGGRARAHSARAARGEWGGRGTGGRGGTVGFEADYAAVAHGEVGDWAQFRSL